MTAWDDLKAAMSAHEGEDRTVAQQMNELVAQSVLDGQTIARLEAENADLRRQLHPAPVFGVASHQLSFRQAGNIYTNDEALFICQDDLGNKITRDLLPTTGGEAWEKAKANVAEHFRRGRQHHLTVGTWKSLTGYDYAKAASRLVELGPALHSIAGVNEPDDAQNGGSIDVWLPKMVEHQRRLQQLRDTTPGLEGIPIANGALRWANRAKWAENAALMKALGDTVDLFNLHFYPGPGADVYAELDAAVQQVRKFTAKPIIITEAGGTTANMPLVEQARIWRDLVLAANAHPDIVLVVLYEVVDDPDGSDRHTDHDPIPGDDVYPDDKQGAVQANFGGYESDKDEVSGFKRKPAADAVRALVVPTK